MQAQGQRILKPISHHLILRGLITQLTSHSISPDICRVIATASPFFAETTIETSCYFLDRKRSKGDRKTRVGQVLMDSLKLGILNDTYPRTIIHNLYRYGDYNFILLLAHLNCGQREEELDSNPSSATDCPGDLGPIIALLGSLPDKLTNICTCQGRF